MSSRHARPVILSFGLLSLSACTPELPEAARAASIPASVKAQAIPLEKAIQDKLLEVRALATHSTRTDMALQLKPLVTSQPWIRIDPGWVAERPEFTQARFVTVQTIYARLPKRRKYTFNVRHCRLKSTGSTGIPSDPQLVRYNGNKAEELVKFLRVTGDKKKDPPWKLVQLGVWSIVEDLEYARVRPEGSDSHLRFRGNEQFATAGEIGQVMDMLEEANLDRTRFRLWEELLAELDKHVVEYENDYTNDPDRAFLSFRQICNFYPLEVAEDIMLSAFDRHEGEAGRNFREFTVEILGEYGTQKEMDVLKRRSDFEMDEKILAQITKILEQHKKTARAAPGR